MTETMVALLLHKYRD